MANRGVNIPKVYIDPDAFKKELKDAGYSIRGIAKYSGVGDRTIRYYLERKEMPVVMFNRIYAALGKKKRLVDADLIIEKLRAADKGYEKLLLHKGFTAVTINQVHKFIGLTIDFIEQNIEEDSL